LPFAYHYLRLHGLTVDITIGIAESRSNRNAGRSSCHERAAE
jgi:hypothetical protein